MKTIAAFGAVLIATGVVVPTVSQAEDNPSVRVSYADLNLATANGQDHLGRRIAHAAETVCYLGETAADLKLVRASTDCRASTIAAAQPQYIAAVAAARHGTVTVLDGAALIITAQ